MQVFLLQVPQNCALKTAHLQTFIYQNDEINAIYLVNIKINDLNVRLRR